MSGMLECGKLLCAHNKESEWAALAERQFVRALDGGCSSPVAAHAQILGKELKLTGLYFEEGMETFRTDTIVGAVETAEKMGEELAVRMKNVEGMQDDEKGKVWLAGAGPGDAGLLTVKTKQLLCESDVIVYDALVSEEVLARSRIMWNGSTWENVRDIIRFRRRRSMPSYFGKRRKENVCSV